MKYLIFILLFASHLVQAQRPNSEHIHGGSDTLKQFNDNGGGFETYCIYCSCGITFWNDSSMTVWGDTLKAIKLFSSSLQVMRNRDDVIKRHKYHIYKVQRLLDERIRQGREVLESLDKLRKPHQ